jgi:hypothetical protein
LITCARSAAESAEAGLRAISSSRSIAAPLTKASSCRRSEGAKFATTRTEGCFSSAAAMSV